MISLNGFSRYRIYKNGTVFNVKKRTWLKGSVNPAGYYHYRLTDDAGVARTIGRHRIVCLMNHGFPPTPKYVVNHINGKKGDDRPENLEWVTYQENAEHAGLIGLTSKCQPVTIRRFLDGKVFKFPSATKAARFIGITKDAVLYRIALSDKTVCPDGYQYRKGLEDGEWPKGQIKGVKVLDHLERKEHFFPDQRKAASFMNISEATLCNYLNKQVDYLLNDRFQAKKISNSKEFRKLGSLIEEKARSNATRAVIAINGKTDEQLTFSSAVECAKHFSISTNTLDYRLSTKGKRVFKDGYKFARLRDFGPAKE